MSDTLAKKKEMLEKLRQEKIKRDAEKEILEKQKA